MHITAISLESPVLWNIISCRVHSITITIMRTTDCIVEILFNIIVSNATCYEVATIYNLICSQCYVFPWQICHIPKININMRYHNGEKTWISMGQYVLLMYIKYRQNIASTVFSIRVLFRQLSHYIETYQQLEIAVLIDVTLQFSLGWYDINLSQLTPNGSAGHADDLANNEARPLAVTVMTTINVVHVSPKSRV